MEFEVKEVKRRIFNLNFVFTTAFIGYLMLLIYLTLFSKYFGRLFSHRGINLVPFLTINRCLNSQNLSITLTNIAGNIAAFVPLGLLFPSIIKRLNKFLIVISITTFTSLAIEIMQYVLEVGISDIDDLILNVLGGAVGFVIFKLIKAIKILN